MNFFDYIMANYTQIITLLLEHIKLTVISVGFAICIGVPLGIFISYIKKANKPILMMANIIQAIPSMALLGFMIPLLGIGKIPSIIAVILYSLLPIIKNTHTGIENINAQTLEAAKAIGLTKSQILAKVQIPLALPMIMAGVRISSVTAVGLMTMAAFIGAGGLGELVFSGIRTVNNNQILAGAIPACMLALIVDFLVSLIEKLVTPISLQKGDKQVIKKNRKFQKITLSILSILMAVVFIATSFNGSNKNDKTIVVGAKDYTEQAILGNMVADMIEAKTDISVERSFDLAGTQIAFGALKTGDIDMYVEYSGTAYTEILKHEPISDTDKVYNIVKKELKDKYGIDVLKQMGFNNTYTLSVKKEFAKKYNLETISDFAKIAKNMESGFTFEFNNREDGLPGIQKAYAFKIGKTISVDGAPRYVALDNNEVDVIDAYSTDGMLKKFDLKVLEDDKSFFPPYYPMPIFNEKTLEEYPEITPIMEKLGDSLSDEIMIELNYKVDELQEKPEKVAKEFLKEKGLI